MAVTLQPEQRDALWAQITADFTLLDDLERFALKEGDEEACYRLGRRLSDGLRLILDGGLGWAPKTTEPTVIKMPDPELKGLIGRMRERAIDLYETQIPEAEESEREFAPVKNLRDACESVLGQID
jgi:hypothetical protein